MKGQATLIEYAFTIILGVTIFISVVALFLNFYNRLLEAEIRDELNQINVQIADSLLRLYDAGKSSKALPSNDTVVLISEVNLKLPQTVARKNYEVKLQPIPTSSLIFTSITSDQQNVTFVENPAGAKILSRTTEDPKIAVEYVLPDIEASVQGTASGRTNSTLRFYRYNSNTTVYDAIAIGVSDVLIRITSVSS